MATYIFFWDPDISSLTKDSYMETFQEGAFFNWSIYEHEHVQTGDEFYMVICGSINAIIAKGFTHSEAWEANDWSPKLRKNIYYVDLGTSVAINPFLTDTLLSGDEVEKVIPDFDWHGGHSGRLLSSENAAKLDEIFETYVKSNPQLVKDGVMWDDEWGTSSDD